MQRTNPLQDSCLSEEKQFHLKKKLLKILSQPKQILGTAPNLMLPGRNGYIFSL